MLIIKPRKINPTKWLVNMVAIEKDQNNKNKRKKRISFTISRNRDLAESVIAADKFINGRFVHHATHHIYYYVCVKSL